MKSIVLILALTICSSSAFADGEIKKEDTICCLTKKPVQKDPVVVRVSSPVAQPKQDLNSSAKGENKADAGAKATTGNQTITINIPQPKQATKIIYRTKREVREVKVYKKKTNPNRLQLLLGATKTKQEVTTDGCGCAITAKRAYEPDLGIQYLRDFGSFTGSVAATRNESFYIGIGFNW